MYNGFNSAQHGGGEYMSRNITILVIILVILLIAGYLIWLRGRFQAPETAAVAVPTPTVAVSPTIVASPSAAISPSSSPSATPRVTRAATTSGRTVR